MTALPAEVGGVRYGMARAADAPAIAALHADSWSRHYRGAYTDAFLDGDVVEERLGWWLAVMGDGNPARRIIAAESGGELTGFVHVVLHEHPVWGALVDNIHVRHDRKRRGIGTELMRRAASLVLDEEPGSGVHLWVLEQNTAAQAFYRSRGGSPAERAGCLAPGVDPSRFRGNPTKIRYVWPDPARLLA